MSKDNQRIINEALINQSVIDLLIEKKNLHKRRTRQHVGKEYRVISKISKRI